MKPEKIDKSSVDKKSGDVNAIPPSDNDIFKITQELPLLTGWGPEEAENIQRFLENDIRGLIRRIAFLEQEADEQTHRSSRATEKLLLSLVEIGDAFNNIFKAVNSKEELVTEQMRKWLDNFYAVHSLLQNILENQGVAPIEIIDQLFDPRWHHAVETVCDPASPDGTIAEIIAPGFIWRNKPLRKVLVKVVRNKKI